MSTFYDNIWASVTVLTKEIVDAVNEADPSLKVQWVDWNEFAELPELPDANVMGPSSLTFTEYEGETSVTFAVGASTYPDDPGGFKLRTMIGIAFERLRPKKQFAYYEAETESRTNVFVILPGTLLAPATRPGARPWQYVQAEALLGPS